MIWVDASWCVVLVLEDGKVNIRNSLLGSRNRKCDCCDKALRGDEKLFLVLSISSI
jgi:hypothetical protein